MTKKDIIAAKELLKTHEKEIGLDKYTKVIFTHDREIVYTEDLNCNKEENVLSIEVKKIKEEVENHEIEGRKGLAEAMGMIFGAILMGIFAVIMFK